MKKPRNKKYVPKPINLIGGIGVIARAQDRIEIQKPLDDEQIADLSIAFRVAFDNMLNGRGDETDLSTCVCSLNIAVVLAEWGTGEEYIPAIVKALGGAFRAVTRAEKTGAFGFDGDAITDIKWAYEIHEAQLECSTREELARAVREVRRRRDGGNVYTREAA